MYSIARLRPKFSPIAPKLSSQNFSSPSKGAHLHYTWYTENQFAVSTEVLKSLSMHDCDLPENLHDCIIISLRVRVLEADFITILSRALMVNSSEVDKFHSHSTHTSIFGRSFYVCMTFLMSVILACRCRIPSENKARK